jgi:leucyl-tRNA synthetase
MQQNWIGKSIGSEVTFELCDEKGNKSGEKVTVFTTRIDTLFGATYMVLAPEHALVGKITTEKHKKNVAEYIEKTRKETDIDRSAEDREKTGVETGAFAVNPANGEIIPVWIGDYVLVTYGTGAVMAVPANDQRDGDFAKKYNLPIKFVVVPSTFEELENIGSSTKIHNKTPTKDQIKLIEKQLTERAIKDYEKYVFTANGVLINSGEFTGLTSEEARKKITEWLAERKSANFTVNYKLRDWLVSRQRYWGAPIPIVFCEKCGEVAVPESELPVLLPKDVDFAPKGDGKSPLNSVESFVHTKCPECGGPAKREVDTMDTFVDSSWYFLRYPSAKMSDKAFDKDMTKNWLPVDMYIGGPEHACMHLLYARFINMVLHDQGFIDFEEPFKRLVHQGMITKDGA